MAATSAPIITLVQQWERRRQWGVILRWLPRTLIPGLIIGIVLFGISRLSPLLPDPINLAITIAACLGGVVGLFGWMWLRPTPLIHIARRFDHDFGLKERLSTALELMDGTISGDPDLTRRQLADAEGVALSLSPEQDLPLYVDIREWLIVLALSAALLVIMLIPPATGTFDEAARQREMIDSSIDAVEEILRQTATSPDLTDEQRSDLLQALESQLQTLRDPDVSTEEAFASLSEIEQTFEDAAQEVQDQLAQQSQAAQQALDALQETQPQAGSIQEAIEQTQQDMSQMSPEQMAQAADSLEQAAQALQSTDPQTAQALQDAAEALRNGDTQAAQDALQRAMQNQMAQDQQTSTQQSQLEQLQRNAQAANQAQQEAADQAESESDSPQQSGESETEGQEGQGEGQGEGGEPGTEPGEGNTPGMGGGDEPELSNMQSSQSTQGQSGLGGDGAGDGNAPLDQDASERLQTRNPNLEQPNNNPDGQGELEYEAIFAPRFSVEAGGDDTVRLTADPGETPLDSGQFQDNPLGESVVPYSAVFSDYAGTATRALDAGYIPLGMRDVVRQYFSSLDPGR